MPVEVKASFVVYAYLINEASCFFYRQQLVARINRILACLDMLVKNMGAAIWQRISVSQAACGRLARRACSAFISIL